MPKLSLRRVRLWTLLALLAAATLRCNGDNVGPRDASAIAMADGNGQTAAVGTALANPLVVLVTDAQNKPVQGVSVGWTVSGGGSVSSASTTTGADGRASVSRTLGPAAGQQTTTATASGLSGSPVTFVSVATNGESGIVITTNPPTNALDGEVFDPTVQPVVHVHNADGSPSVGATVTATIVSGGGSLQGTTTATTDAQGFATFGDLGIRGPGSQTLSFATASDAVAASPVSIAPLPPQATTGQWGPLVPWDIVPLHMSLLPTGKIIGWGKYEDENNQGSGTMGSIPRLWDPAAGDPTTARMVQADTMLFCSGHTGMPDGRIMVSGGHKADDTGIDNTNIFDPVSEQWVPGLPKMAFGRWYPTVTVLADGRILTMAGRDSAGKVVTIPEIWENNQWVQLPGASAVNIPYYPRNFVAPNGKIFMAGERIESRWFDVDATVSGKRGVWTDGPNHIWHFNRDYGTAAMYEPGKILYAGGGGNATWAQTPDARASTPTNTAELIDLNQPVPQWSNAGTMQFARRHTNSTILPDGTVLVTGGTTGGGFVDINPADAAKAAELWDPKHPTQWTTLASNSVMRVYHSVSLLLPDGTVLHGASGNALAGGANPVPVPDEKNHEIFSPPYLFKGARPTITTVPASVGYGATFSVTTPNHAQVTDVRWIRLGSVTHAFDAGQRANTLSFTATATGVDVTAPASPNLAPPGYYQIFILNRNGVPSAGKMIQVH